MTSSLSWLNHTLTSGRDVIQLHSKIPKKLHKLLVTVHPPRRTWNLKMDPWKRRFLLETIISRFHVENQGCRPLFQASCHRCFLSLVSRFSGFLWPLQFMTSKTKGRLGTFLHPPETNMEPENIYPLWKRIDNYKPPIFGFNVCFQRCSRKKHLGIVRGPMSHFRSCTWTTQYEKSSLTESYWMRIGADQRPTRTITESPNCFILQAITWRDIGDLERISRIKGTATQIKEIGRLCEMNAKGWSGWTILPFIWATWVVTGYKYSHIESRVIYIIQYPSFWQKLQ